MDKAIVRYRVLVTLVTIAVSTGLIVGNHHLAAGYQLFAWGVAIGLLSTFGYIVATWFFDLSLLALIVFVPLIGTALRYSFGFGLGYPSHNYYWLGEGLGLAAMITISLVLPLRTPARSIPPRRKTTPPLEESSSYKLVWPRTPEPHRDKQRPD
jgi:hypothetical protein